MRDTITRIVGKVDLDGIVAPVVLAIGAEQLVPGAGLFTLGIALYVPLLIERSRRRA